MFDFIRDMLGWKTWSARILGNNSVVFIAHGGKGSVSPGSSFHVISWVLNIEVRDSPHGIFGSWARWNRAPPDGQSSWETAAAAVAVAVAVAAPPRAPPRPRPAGARRPPTPRKEFLQISMDIEVQ